jgi:hypothetical protein
VINIIISVNLRLNPKLIIVLNLIVDTSNYVKILT